ncbi:MAG: hypothetical protein OES69_08760 [Myxococcales bacterium]|nr:hypothetical protein [Myxococcales bacterium]
MWRKQILQVILVLISLAPMRASAEESEEPEPEVGEVSSLKQDLTVPDSPAFVALGLNPEEVARPATVHEFATAVLTGLDKNGNLQLGLALDFAPYLMIKGDDLTITEYRASYGKQLLSNFQVSLATTKGTNSDDESVRLGLGLRATFWNRGDPRTDDETYQCLVDSGSIPDRKGFTTPEEYHKAVEQKFAVVKSAVASCITQSEARLWNASAFDFGAAPTLIQEGGTSSNISWGGATFWSSVAYGFDSYKRSERKKKRGRAAEEKPGEEERDEKKQTDSKTPWATEKSQLILHVRFRLGEQDPVAQDVFVKQNNLLIGTRWRAGTPYLAFNLEASYVLEDPEGASAISSFRGAVNADIKIIDQTWLLLTLGITAARDNTTLQLGAGLKWGGRKIDLASLAKSVGDGQGLAATAAAIPPND